MKAYAVMQNKEFVSGVEKYELAELDMLNIFRTREDAQEAADWWNNNAEVGHEVVEVYIQTK